MSARPSYGVDEALLDQARQRADEARGYAAEDIDRIVDEFQRDATAAGLEPAEYLRSVVEACDVSSPPNGALLWSGRSPDDRNLSNRYVAEAWAERQNADDAGHPVTTIEATPGGAQLDGLRLYDWSLENFEALDISEAARAEAWERLSERYTEQATGQVRAFATDAYPGAVLYQTELPELRMNPEVGADRVEFAYEPPEQLSTGEPVPENVRAVMAEPGNQTRLQMYDPSKPGYLNPTAGGALSPDALRDDVARLHNEVAEADRARFASRTGSGPLPGPAPAVPPTPAPGAAPRPGTPALPTQPTAVDDGAPHSGLPPSTPAAPSRSTGVYDGSPHTALPPPASAAQTTQDAAGDRTPSTVSPGLDAPEPETANADEPRPTPTPGPQTTPETAADADGNPDQDAIDQHFADVDSRIDEAHLNRSAPRT